MLDHALDATQRGRALPDRDASRDIDRRLGAARDADETMNSVNSRRRLSTSIVPPCHCVTMS
jgi:hypothetical protein